MKYAEKYEVRRKKCICFIDTRYLHYMHSKSSPQIPCLGMYFNNKLPVPVSSKEVQGAILLGLIESRLSGTSLRTEGAHEHLVFLDMSYPPYSTPRSIPKLCYKTEGNSLGTTLVLSWELPLSIPGDKSVKWSKYIPPESRRSVAQYAARRGSKIFEALSARTVTEDI